MTSTGQFSWTHSPVSGHPHATILMWDGRVDNPADLLQGIRRPVPSDGGSAAAVLAAYARDGIKGLGRVIGDWSVVIHDAPEGAIVLASDFAGVRPLYYRWQLGQISWSTRLTELVEATETEALDEEYIAGFLSLGGCPNRTPYAGIYSVPPGCAVCATATSVHVGTFWALPTGDVIRYRDERRYDEQLRWLFREAVAVRLQTDEPVVAELSGGLDSSSVVCMANQLIRGGDVPAPRLTMISYVHRDSLDTPFMHEVEAFCGIQGVHLSTHEHPLTSEAEVGQALPDGWVPLHRAVSSVAHGLGARVFLTGQGGDLMMGNWPDDSLQVAARLRSGRLGSACREALEWSKAMRMPVTWTLARAFLAALPASWQTDAVYEREGTLQPSAETSLRPDFCRRSGVGRRVTWSTEWMQAPPERRKHFRALTLMRELRALGWAEPMEGCDYTHPFAHRPLVEFLMSVPADVLCRPGEPRRLMRRALGDLLPRRLRTRKSKSLFGTPWAEALRPLATRLLAEREWHVVERGWLDRPSLANRLQRLTHGIECNEPQLRQIILLEYWLRSRGVGHGAAALLSA
ncbi:MAG TPA: asparagine synthase-related protein [Vicinamibacterales bacterium]|nr:asparagine synthase-related protein [Vicinamibacterales bacterium]